jgi:hypothetical protein
VGGVVVHKLKKGLLSLTVSFNEPLNSTGATNLGLYRVLGGVKKHRKTVYSKALAIRSATYDDSARTVTVNLAKRFKGSMQFTVGAGIPGANGASSTRAFTTVVI